MIYKFYAHGHPNILSTHKTTLEFTKDDEVSLKGDCIVGVNADFDLEKIKGFIRHLKNKNIEITITANKNIQDKINAEVNTIFGSNKEFVIRKTNFISDRTFATRSNKAAFELNRQLIDFLKKKGNKITVNIEYQIK